MNKINIGDKVKFLLCDIVYEIVDIRKQGGIRWACIMSGYGYEWHQLSILRRI